MQLINHKLSAPFPPRGENTTEILLRELKSRNPKYCFAIEWPENGDEPIFHTSTSDMPVLTLRLQNFLSELYAGKHNDKFFIEEVK